MYIFVYEYKLAMVGGHQKSEFSLLYERSSQLLSIHTGQTVFIPAQDSDLVTTAMQRARVCVCVCVRMGIQIPG